MVGVHVEPNTLGKHRGLPQLSDRPSRTPLLGNPRISVSEAPATGGMWDQTWSADVLEDCDEQVETRAEQLIGDRERRQEPEHVAEVPQVPQVSTMTPGVRLSGHPLGESRVRGRGAGLDELDGHHRPAAANLTDPAVGPLQRLEAVRQRGADDAGPLDEAVLLDGLEHRQCGGAREEIGAVGAPGRLHLPGRPLISGTSCEPVVLATRAHDVLPIRRSRTAHLGGPGVWGNSFSERGWSSGTTWMRAACIRPMKVLDWKIPISR
jgi:hypothetical protein